MRIPQWVLGRVLGCVLGAGVVLAGGCGQAQGPGPQRPPSDPVPAETLAVKLRALSSDSCAREPSAQKPAGCEKFVTQLGNTAATAAETARSGHPDLAGPAGRMARGVEGYRTQDCASEEPRDEPACVRIMVELAAALTDAETALTR